MKDTYKVELLKEDGWYEYSTHRNVKNAVDIAYTIGRVRIQQSRVTKDGTVIWDSEKADAEQKMKDTKYGADMQ